MAERRPSLRPRVLKSTSSMLDMLTGSSYFGSSGGASAAGKRAAGRAPARRAMRVDRSAHGLELLSGEAGLQVLEEQSLLEADVVVQAVAGGPHGGSRIDAIFQLLSQQGDALAEILVLGDQPLR